MKIKKENERAVMLVAPSDHWIEDEQAFSENVSAALNYCQSNDALMTLGIEPAFPNTGYGYIEYEKTLSDEMIKPVRQFREKPDYQTAKEFIAQGNYLWNAGIFMWSASSILKSFEQLQPELYQLFLKGQSYYNTEREESFIADHYALAENISVDYAIMEPSSNVYVISATFDWNDLGTWGSLYDKLDKDEHGNAIVNSVTYLLDAKNNMIRSKKDKLVVVDGISDYIIVNKEEVLLIFPKTKEQDIKQILQGVKRKFGDRFS